MGWYRYVNALSLDVVAGALISTLFFARLLEVQMPTETLVALGLAVWVIYTFDHLWDAYRRRQPMLTFRHQIHQKHFRKLASMAVVALLAGLLLVQRLPSSTIDYGIAISLMVLFYFLVTGWLNTASIYHKEILIALIYTGGVLAGPLSLHHHPISPLDVVLMVQFALLAFVNLLIFAYYESDIDKLQHFPSLQASVGSKTTRYLIAIILSLIAIVSLILAFYTINDWLVASSYFTVMIMAGMLALVFCFPRIFAVNDRFRYLGDAAFLVPILVL